MAPSNMKYKAVLVPIVLDADRMDEWVLSIFENSNPSEPLVQNEPMAFHEAVKSAAGYVERNPKSQLHITIERVM